MTLQFFLTSHLSAPPPPPPTPLATPCKKQHSAVQPAQRPQFVLSIISNQDRIRQIVRMLVVERLWGKQDHEVIAFWKMVQQHHRHWFEYLHDMAIISYETRFLFSGMYQQLPPELIGIVFKILRSDRSPQAQQCVLALQPPLPPAPPEQKIRWFQMPVSRDTNWRDEGCYSCDDGRIDSYRCHFSDDRWDCDFQFSSDEEDGFYDNDMEQEMDDADVPDWCANLLRPTE